MLSGVWTLYRTSSIIRLNLIPTLRASASAVQKRSRRFCTRII
ncbi:hypothetical protein HMPREF0201_03977 [Cedecea davisae DSM 4568]|uniref:Uncharacterized protein n=1 Tax=Cedecea davisae DSM 4568 TaxID=566551 RepID=S3JKI7_9ENTR|nr:hypothetical protein HMPREF0201_03977 [Cedecea davisae DSM 4568]